MNRASSRAYNLFKYSVGRCFLLRENVEVEVEEGENKGSNEDRNLFHYTNHSFSSLPVTR